MKIDFCTMFSKFNEIPRNAPNFNMPNAESKEQRLTKAKRYSIILTLDN